MLPPGKGEFDSGGPISGPRYPHGPNRGQYNADPPPGYETPTQFAKRHGTSANQVNQMMRLPDYPLPHVIDKPTGRYYVHRIRGDRWLEERAKRLSGKRSVITAAESVRDNIMKGLERLKPRLQAAGFERSASMVDTLISVIEAEFETLTKQRDNDAPRPGY